MWLAAENGVFVRQYGGEWMVTAPELLQIGCSDSIKVHAHGELCSAIADSCLF
jgi:trehalose-6-phosphatase